VDWRNVHYVGRQRCSKPTAVCSYASAANVIGFSIDDSWPFIANVDAALKRFMVEWFPVETKEKEKANEREAAEEELREMGFNPADNKCLVQ
jgi:hypothetical protein